METVDTMLEKLISDPLTDVEIKEIEKQASAKVIRPRLSMLLLENKDKILDSMYSSPTVDLQLKILRMIMKLLTKKQIQESKYFSNITSFYSKINRMDRNSILEFLILFNNNYDSLKPHFVIGCRIKRFSSKFKNIEFDQGLLFINDCFIKIYGIEKTVVVFYKSINTVQIKDHLFILESIESKNVEIEFYDDKGFESIRDKIQQLFLQQLSTDSSISLNVDQTTNKMLVGEEKVSFKVEESNKTEAEEMKHKTVAEEMQQSLLDHGEMKLDLSQFNEDKITQNTFQDYQELEHSEDKIINNQSENQMNFSESNSSDSISTEVEIIKNKSSGKKSLKKLKSFKSIKNKKARKSVHSKNKAFETKCNSNKQNLKYFKEQKVFGDSFHKKIEELHQLKLEYNKANYQILNNKAKKMKNLILKQLNTKIYLIKK